MALMGKRDQEPLNESGKTLIISISEFMKFKPSYVFRQVKKEFDAFKARSTAKKLQVLQSLKTVSMIHC